MLRCARTSEPVAYAKKTRRTRPNNDVAFLGVDDDIHTRETYKRDADK